MSQRNRKVVFSDEGENSKVPLFTKRERAALIFYTTLDTIKRKGLSWLFYLALLFAAIQIVRYYLSISSSEAITSEEIRFYVLVFFTLVAVIAFSILRMYNAIVRNTGALHSLKQALSSNSTALKDHTREYSNITKLWERSTHNLSSAIKHLYETISRKDGNKN
jgi:hypothetical protein